MGREATTSAPPTIALICGEPRLCRILRLALEADGYEVRECARLRELVALGAVAAAVVDLDSLRLRPAAREAYLRTANLSETLPTLFISVYPMEGAGRSRPGPTDYLQPPFPADEVARRVERLLRAAGRPGVADRPGDCLAPRG